MHPLTHAVNAPPLSFPAGMCGWGAAHGPGDAADPTTGGGTDEGGGSRGAEGGGSKGAEGGRGGGSGRPAPRAPSALTSKRKSDPESDLESDLGTPVTAASVPTFPGFLPVPEDRKRVGDLCRRLVDEGRRRWLLQRGFTTAELVAYVPEATSPENLLLLAAR